MTSYPAILGRMRPVEILRQVLEPLMSGGKEPSAREVMDEILNMLACKAAIKAGEVVDPASANAPGPIVATASRRVVAGGNGRPIETLF